MKKSGRQLPACEIDKGGGRYTCIAPPPSALQGCLIFPPKTVNVNNKRPGTLIDLVRLGRTHFFYWLYR